MARPPSHATRSEVPAVAQVSPVAAVRFGWVALSLAGGAAAGWCLLIADALARKAWADIHVPAHFAAGLVLAGVVGSLFGAIAVAFVAIIRFSIARTSLRWPRVSRVIAPLLCALASAVAIWPTATWMFSGEGVQGSALGKLGRYAVIAGTALGVAVGCALFQLGARWAARRRGRLTLALAAGGALVTISLVRVDLTTYVSLYSRLHTVIETVAFGTAGAVAVLVLIQAAGRYPRGVFRLAAVCGCVGLACGVSYAASSSLRRWTADSLRHVWREPAYLGRVLARAQIAESFASNPGSWTDATMAGVHRLRERYDIMTTARDPAWDSPPEELPALQQASVELRQSDDPNILIYYVDTLRADVASDPAIMPNTVRFAATSLNFENAYTTGSDTLHALPGMTGGSYDLFEERPSDVLRVAERAGVHSVLFAPRSAAEFLAKLLPRFRFKETVIVDDYDLQNKQVWGYGADQATADRLVDETLTWVEAHPHQRFLGWVFNFDVHNWRELDESHIQQSAARFGVEEQGALNFRYRVAARSVDEEFGRLLAGLEQIENGRDTVIVFLSDHGEALGREGFWVHSTFLWETLIRVPLIVRAPNVAPRNVRARVSLVDVAPTLSRYLMPQMPTAAYHGEDLLSYVVNGRSARRLPLLVVGTHKEKLVRLGVIDPVAPYKLVLPLEAAVPELYDLAAEDPDAQDVSQAQRAQMLRMLSSLVRGPLFPRLAPVGPVDAGAEQASVRGD